MRGGDKPDPQSTCSRCLILAPNIIARESAALAVDKVFPGSVAILGSSVGLSGARHLGMSQKVDDANEPLALSCMKAFKSLGDLLRTFSARTSSKSLDAIEYFDVGRIEMALDDSPVMRETVIWAACKPKQDIFNSTFISLQLSPELLPCLPKCFLNGVDALSNRLS